MRERLFTSLEWDKISLFCRNRSKPQTREDRERLGRDIGRLLSRKAGCHALSFRLVLFVINAMWPDEGGDADCVSDSPTPRGGPTLTQEQPSPDCINQQFQEAAVSVCDH